MLQQEVHHSWYDLLFHPFLLSTSRASESRIVRRRLLICLSKGITHQIKIHIFQPEIFQCFVQRRSNVLRIMFCVPQLAGDLSKLSSIREPKPPSRRSYEKLFSWYSRCFDGFPNCRFVLIYWSAINVPISGLKSMIDSFLDLRRIGRFGESRELWEVSRMSKDKEEMLKYTYVPKPMAGIS